MAERYEPRTPRAQACSRVRCESWTAYPNPCVKDCSQKPACIPVVVRLAQGPGEVLSDSVSTHRGMAIKVFGVGGVKLPGHEAAQTQDFVLATGPAFP